MRYSACAGRMLVGLLLGCACGAAWADDVTTLSGATYHDARAVRVEPDGVTWEHATGMAKVDFTDLPEAVRKQYHYDAAKATAYTAAQAKAQEESAALVQQAQRETGARQAERFQARMQTEAESKPGEFVYRRLDRTVEKLARSMGEEIDARKAAEARLKEFDGTIYDRRLWAIPCMLFGHSDGHLFDVRPTPTDFGAGVNYQAKSWNERLNVEAAEAARDKR